MQRASAKIPWVNRGPEDFHEPAKSHYCGQSQSRIRTIQPRSIHSPVSSPLSPSTPFCAVNQGVEYPLNPQPPSSPVPPSLSMPPHSEPKAASFRYSPAVPQGHNSSRVESFDNYPWLEGGGGHMQQADACLGYQTMQQDATARVRHASENYGRLISPAPKPNNLPYHAIFASEPDPITCFDDSGHCEDVTTKHWGPMPYGFPPG
jgi:hypothetical protein